MSCFINKKNKKILNGIIAGLFCVSNIIPSVTFAAVSADNSANLQAKATDTDKAVENNINNNSDLSSLGKKDVSGGSTSASTSGSSSSTTKEDELVSLNKKQNENSKSQQKNSSSISSTASYIVTDKNGDSVTVTTNPCYLSTSESCKQVYTQSVLNSSGDVTSYRTVPLNTLKFTTSNQSALTSNMESQLNTQINMNNTINNASSNGSVVTSYVTSALSSLSPNASWSDKLSAVGMALVSGMQAQQQIEKQAQSNKVLENTTDTLKAVGVAKGEIAQQKRDVLKQTSKRYTAKITPTIPTISDNLDVTLTLVTPTGSSDSSNYTIKAKVLNQDTKKWVWLDVYENQPFTIEKGNWSNRTMGSRTVSIVYTFKDNTKEPETSTVTYNVGQMANAILPDGRNVTNSVTALNGNADILNYNQSTTSVAGKITKAKWVQDGNSSYCSIGLTDDKNNTGKYSEASIETNNIPQDNCNENLVGKYASFTDISVKTNTNGEYVFQDLSNSSSVNYSMSESNYNDLEDNIAKTTQDAQSKLDTPSLVVNKETGEINTALPGELGINYVYIPSWKTCLAVSENSDGTISFKKADGTEYTEAELKNKVPVASTTYKNVTFGKDANGKIYAMSNGNVISGNFDSESLSSASKSVNLSTIPTANLIKSSDIDNNYSSLLLNAISNSAKATTSAINHLSNIGSLTDTTSYNSSSNLVTGVYSNTPENDVANSNYKNDVFENAIADGCKNKSATECNLFKQQLDSLNLNK